MKYLRQSTQVVVTLGKAVDDTDGKTPETILYNAAGIDVDVYKNGTRSDVTLAAAAGDGYWIHAANGYHNLTLSTGHTDTVGRLRVTADATGVLGLWEDFHVLEEAVYDALFATSATGKLPATLATADVSGNLAAQVKGIDADAITAASVKADAVTKLQAGLSTFDPAAADVTVAGFATGVAAALATLIEAALVNETDATHLLQALTDKIALAFPDLDDVTLIAFAAAMRADIERAGGMLELAKLSADAAARPGATMVPSIVTPAAPSAADNAAELERPAGPLATLAGTDFATGADVTAAKGEIIIAVTGQAEGDTLVNHLTRLDAGGNIVAAPLGTALGIATPGSRLALYLAADTAYANPQRMTTAAVDGTYALHAASGAYTLVVSKDRHYDAAEGDSVITRSVIVP